MLSTSTLSQIAMILAQVCSAKFQIMVVLPPKGLSDLHGIYPIHSSQGPRMYGFFCSWTHLFLLYTVLPPASQLYLSCNMYPNIRVTYK